MKADDEAAAAAAIACGGSAAAAAAYGWKSGVGFAGMAAISSEEDTEEI